MSVKVDSLTKIYGSQRAIDSISFEVKSGEIVGFLGPNGAGKSTTMKIISCFTLPTSGNAFVNGIDILTDPVEIRRNIGYLPEHNPLYEDMYVREYLFFIAQLHKISGSYSKRVSEMIELTGLTPERHKKIQELSKGFKQRVGIAQALIHNPDVLLLDEPTSGLDPNQVVDIRKLIVDIGKTKTVILSSHIMQEVQAMCNRVIIINEGKIVADDKTESLVAKTDKGILIQVEFKKAIKRADLNKLKGLIHAENQQGKWLLKLNDIKSREFVFEFAVQTGNTILEMSPIRENLEQVFQQITNTKQ
ncbi:MAG: gliding motility-associated ABC transporter ATP-binding subunit GldA [Bacteroidetes bacterium]|nr:gliding motility-associated ABC transporter ATP-binding subunit GldA [Bacteroidota bacterium]MBT5528915.1 gliding motility-associated ABC transporter ATP-binding subunit GldA [Cytophagia bacterium]MBT3802799.1 gliding motility-associated ABC transporter ATP-binding subunit GldA [Bacteroidota bacterium]MBT4340387.1 gliding motility-associated ABC transporter ATP-binding subunit GldA [Bacteroidota bacterium]MBT4969290.1 gliding motility-associated ABC transporter ATP-binding subunit GldA [Bact